MPRKRLTSFRAPLGFNRIQIAQRCNKRPRTLSNQLLPDCGEEGRDYYIFSTCNSEITNGWRLRIWVRSRRRILRVVSVLYRYIDSVTLKMAIMLLDNMSTYLDDNRDWRQQFVESSQQVPTVTPRGNKPTYSEIAVEELNFPPSRTCRKFWHF